MSAARQALDLALKLKEKRLEQDKTLKDVDKLMSNLLKHYNNTLENGYSLYVFDDERVRAYGFIAQLKRTTLEAVRDALIKYIIGRVRHIQVSENAVDEVEDVRKDLAACGLLDQPAESDMTVDQFDGYIREKLKFEPNVNYKFDISTLCSTVIISNSRDFIEDQLTNIINP